jgi:ADP-ribose pyrophosphatase YjhB (NUDIX family)
MTRRDLPKVFESESKQEGVMAQTSAAEKSNPMTHPVKPIVTVSLVESGHVLYVHMKEGPDAQSGLFLPNDVLHFGEDPYDGARRIAKEQAGVDVKQPTLLDVESFEGHDGSWHLAFHFRADIPDRKSLVTSKSIGQTRWSAAGQLPADAEVAHGGWYNSIAKRALQQGKTG